jgi:hypothetical protein
MSRLIAPPGAAAALVVLSICLPAWGQGVGDAAQREKERRARDAARSPSAPTETSVPTRATTDGAAGAAAQPSTEGAVARAVPSGTAVVSPAALLRHLASAEEYLHRCERDLTQATDRWLSASQANKPRAAEEARRALEAATRQLERARAYREEAETAARRAGVHPATP